MSQRSIVLVLAACALSQVSAGPPSRQTEDIALVASFLGIGDEGQSSPDSGIAASDTTLVLVRNSAIAIRTKSGALLGLKTIPAFFASVAVPGEGFYTDPYVIFDTDSARFFVANRARVDVPGCVPGTCISHILLAVSKGPRPATLEPADWHFYALDRTLVRPASGAPYFTDDTGDFDHIGIVGGAVVIGWQPVTTLPTVLRGRLRVLDKSTLINGLPVTTWTDFTAFEQRPRPAITFGAPDHAFFDVSAGCEGARQGWQIGAVSNLGTSPTLTIRTVTVADERPCLTSVVFEAPQAGTGSIVRVEQLMTPPVYRDGSLWVARNLDYNFGSGLVSAIRWVELDVSQWPDEVRVKQAGTVEADGVWQFAPALMVDRANNFVVVYTRSSSAEFASLYYAGRIATDPPGTLRAGVALKAGVTSFTGSNRFVDYHGVALDPVDGGVWAMGVYASASTVSHAWVGKLALSGGAFDLRVTQGGGGSGTVTSSPSRILCGSDCGERFALNSIVSLSAVPAGGSIFAGWRGDPDCADGAVTMVAARSCTAIFVTALGIAPTSGAADLNGDGGGDVFRYHPFTGAWSMELGDRSGGFGAQGGVWSSGWTLHGGDFNGDRLTDLFLLNQSIGVWVRALNGGRGDFSYFSSRWDPGWRAYVNDFDTDGRSDLFIYNAQTGDWFKCMTAGTGDFGYIGGRWDPGWEIYPVELNGDRRGDLFLYNRTTGQWIRALDEGAAGFSYYGEAWAPGWGIYPADFNGDGRSDIFLYDPVAGQWFICTNTGTTFTYVAGTWSSGWSVTTGDFDGNGRADVLLYNPANGQWFECLNTGSTDFSYFAGSWSGGWQTFATDLNADRRSDVLLYNAATGQWFQCLSVGAGRFDYGSGSWDPGLTILAAGSRIP